MITIKNIVIKNNSTISGFWIDWNLEREEYINKLYKRKLLREEPYWDIGNYTKTLTVFLKDSGVNKVKKELNKITK